MSIYLKTKRKYLIAVVAIFVLVGFITPQITHAITIDPLEMAASFIKSRVVNKTVELIADALAYFVQYVIIWILGVLLGVAGMLMDNVLKFTDLKSTGVVQGWTILRDLVNMLFILVLLVVAFATVLNIQKYHVKDILPRLVIVALLVNFSMTITFAVVDASQFLMYGFYNAMTSGLKGDCATLTPGVCFSQMAMIKQLLVDSSSTSTAGQAWVTLGNLVMGAIFLFVFTVVVVAGSLLLVIRIVGIWVAVIFSPFAFFSYMLPSLNKFAQTWLTKFLQYTFFGPIYVFFLWLSLILLQYVPSFLQAKGLEDYKTYINAPVNNFVKYLGNVLQYIMVITLLLWSFMITRKLGIHYGEKIAGGAEKFMWDSAHSVGKKFSGYNMGKRYVDAYKARREDVERKKKARVEERYNRRVGGAKEFVGGTVGKAAERIPIAGRLLKRFGVSRWGEEQSRQAEFQYESRVGEEQKKVAHITDGNQLHDVYTRAVKKEEKEAILRRAAEVGGLDDLLIKAGEHDDNDGLRRFMIKEFGNNDRSAKVAKVLADITAMKTHQTQFQGVADYDSKTGGYTFDVDPNIRSAKIFKAAGGDYPQSLGRQLRKHQFGTYGAGGAFVGVNEDLTLFLDELQQGGIDWQEIAKQLKPEVVKEIEKNRAAYDAVAGTAAGASLNKLFDELKSQHRISP